MIKRSAIVALCAAALALGACQSTHRQSEGAAVQAMNKTCPYSGEGVDAAITSTYNGKTIAFCCNGCKAKFDGASAEKKSAVMAKAK